MQDQYHIHSRARRRRAGCLERDDIIEKISHSNWAALIVTVPKKDGSVRICGNYKVTVNPVLEGDQYPLPRAEDLSLP